MTEVSFDVRVRQRGYRQHLGTDYLGNLVGSGILGYIDVCWSLVYAGYLMLRRSIDEPTQRGRLSAALSIFGTVDIVIVWKSIEWWRTQHPGPVLSIRTGGGNIDPAMEHMIFRNFLALLLIAAAMVLVRARQETMEREIDSLRRLAHA